MENEEYLLLLNEKNSFNRSELQAAMSAAGLKLGEASFKKKLQELLATHKIARVGRNAYRVSRNDVAQYRYDYSVQVEKLSEVIKDNFPYVDYSIFELRQLNEFLNHQIAHNIVFLSVENDVLSFVFETLKEYFDGMVMLSPTIELFNQYWRDDMIVLTKRVTEAPKGMEENWHSRIEKILVDLIAEPLIQCSVNSGEYSSIFEDVFQRYVVDESCLFRYARRRGADKELKAFLQNNTSVKLHTVG